jgi:HEAT repeat protein
MNDGAPRPRRTPGFLVAAACAAATSFPSPAAGQDTPFPGGGSGGSRGKKPPIEIELPPAMVREAEARSASPDAVVARLRGDLLRWPGAASRAAIAELTLSGPEVVPPLRALIDGFDFGPKVGAAMALVELRDPEAFARVERLLADRRASAHAGALLDALVRLDPERAERTALELARSRDAALRRAALQSLTAHAGPQTIPGLRGLLASDDAKTRLDAFLLLEKLEAAELEVDAMRLLGDSSSELAVKATEWLVRKRSDAVIAELSRIAREDPPGRSSLWALLTLAEIEERTSQPVLREDLIPLLEPRLRSIDPLVRISAAIALAHLGARAPSGGEELLSTKVVPAIIETFVRGEYFKDALPLLRMSSTRLERLTGVDLGTDLTRWREAWYGGGATPRIRRDLDPTALVEGATRLRVVYESKGLEARGGGRDRVVTLAGDAALDAQSAEFERPLYVAADAMKSLAEKIVASGVLEGRNSAPDRVEGGGHRLIRVTLENRERTVALSAAADAAFDAVEAEILALADAQHWQRLWVGDASRFAAWYASEAPSFAATIDGADRGQRLLRLVLVALPKLDAPARCDAFAAVRAHPAAVAELALADFHALAAGLADEPYAEGPWMMLAALAVDRGEPLAIDAVAAALVNRYGTAAEAVAGRLCVAAGGAPGLLESPHPTLRLAAVEAARARPAAVPTERLLERLDDEDPRVLRAAVLAIAAQGDEPAVLAIERMASDPLSPLRRAAIEAAGLLPPSRGRAILEAATADPDLAICRAALLGHARAGGADGVRALEAAAKVFVEDAARRSAAIEALSEVAGETASAALRRLLAEAQGAVALEIAFHLAHRLDDAAGPVLLAALQRGDDADRARDALEALYCTDGGERGEIFSQRVAAGASRSNDEWLLLAVDPTLLERGGGIGTASLLAALRDERWFVRQAAATRLLARHHVPLQVPGRFAAPEQFETFVARVTRWLEATSRGA